MDLELRIPLDTNWTDHDFAIFEPRTYIPYLPPIQRIVTSETPLCATSRSS